MTIAVCCVSPEGVVFGADSTASLMVPEGFHYLNHNQKLFQVGEISTLAAVTWGLAALGNLSHRSQLAQLADDLAARNIRRVEEASVAWVERFWPHYDSFIAPHRLNLQALASKAPFKAGTAPSSSMRSETEQKEYDQLYLGLMVGFCIGGYDPADRTACAFETIFDPVNGKPTPSALVMGQTRCWGAPKVFSRMVMGIDPDVHQAILSSGYWVGSPNDLQTILGAHQLYLPGLPIRDAVDFVHSCISSTIKTLKFSHLSQTCGGPIELAVITTDRDFRWVRHKDWDVAISEGHPL